MNEVLHSAGGVVTWNEHILLMFKKGRWDLPKGKIEGNDSVEFTALKEIFEETGVPQDDLAIERALVPTHHFTRLNGEHVLKKTDWFWVKYTNDKDPEFKPLKEEGIVYCRFVPLWEIDKYIEKSRPRISYLLDFFLSFYNRQMLGPDSLK